MNIKLALTLLRLATSLLSLKRWQRGPLQSRYAVPPPQAIIVPCRLDNFHEETIMDLIGKTLGHYRIVERIGQGGMATIFKAHQPALDRFVAIKVLPAQQVSLSVFCAKRAPWPNSTTPTFCLFTTLDSKAT
jgi:serine/threonine protein kinase